MQIDHPTAKQIPGLRSLWQEAFGDDDAFLDLFFSHAYSPLRCLCITAENTVLAAAYWFSCAVGSQRCAYIYAVATARSHRGQGLCHRLMDAIHNELDNAGYCGSIVVPGDQPLRTLYRGMGYTDMGGMDAVSCTANDKPVPLQPCTAEEYALARRGFLPHNSVIQEAENLDFLSHFASFYQGENFILCAGLQEGILQGLELLGDFSAAPGILQTLGAQQGHFRIPGATPFAMYRPLREADHPTYFAFAFD